MNLKLTLSLGAAALVARTIYRDGPSCAAHNLVAHPLLVLAPPLGELIHDVTDPTPGRGWVLLRQPIRFGR